MCPYLTTQRVSLSVQPICSITNSFCSKAYYCSNESKCKSTAIATDCTIRLKQNNKI